MEKLEIDKTDFHFATATTTTNYNQLWDTDSEGKVRPLIHAKVRLWNYASSVV